MGSLRIAGLFLLVAGPVLVLLSMPRVSFADVCRDLNQGPGCVTPRDVKRNAVKASRRLDEAGTNFIAKAERQFDISVPDVFAKIVVDAPAAGTIIVNAAITIEALKNPGPGVGPGVPNGRGSVECALTNGGSRIELNNPNRFFGSVDFDEGLVYDTLAITRGFTVSSKAETTIALACKVISGNGLLLRGRAPSISAAYYANRN